ncbi:MAG TPA: hypothetical protein PJ986_15160 [Gammaproteobacteria bacterium]|nr:hypothetical protein [Gammaproteobacteria bacterium]
MKIRSQMFQNETLAAALAGLAGFAVLLLLAAVLASRLQMPVWP